MKKFLLVCAMFCVTQSAVAANVVIRNSNSYDIAVVVYRDIRDCALMSGDGSNCQAWNHLWQMQAWRTVRAGQSITVTTNSYSCVGASRNGVDLVQRNLDAGNLFTGDLNYVYAASGSVSTVQVLSIGNSRIRVQVQVGDRHTSQDMAESNLSTYLIDQGLRYFRCLESNGNAHISL